ncbi:MAG: 1D-myo-inositol 2-acetamido-2-deoxy-alpha-D-glucopyranoside deacetylase [Pseudomonadota bacterium]|jgi:bacillithiol biosynthesis deacetylase BshB1
MESVALVISPHPDDAEIAMGGTIASLIQQGVRVVVADLTDGEPTPHGSVEKRQQEAAAASRILGITERRILTLKNREVFDTLENRKIVASLIREVRPDILFGPYFDDVHPDHVQGAALVESARFYAKFVKGDLPHSPWYPRKHLHFFSTHIKPRFQPSFIFDVTGHLDAKMASIEAYESQFIINEGNAKRLEEIRTEALYWGCQVGVGAGEPFLCRETIKVSTPAALFNV